MRRQLTKALFLSAAITAVFSGGYSPTINALEIVLPADTSRLRESELPGYALAQQKCGICHSANYISYQPPGMSLDQWTAEMAKMQHSYGAPIDQDEIKLIGAYLAVEYGSANATDTDVEILTAAASAAGMPAASAGDAGKIDVQSLLLANACTGCHAVDKRLVGPSFQDVAHKYADVGDALALLVHSIKQGGAGKWGEIPMPAMPALSDDEARALAGYVLEQR